jgi:hypothetical protein
MVLVGIGFAAAFASGAFESERGTSGSQVCENAFCLKLPDGWTGATAYGGGSNQIIAAPFTLPPIHQGGGLVSIPRERFIITVSVYRRGYLFGWPRRQTLAISADQLKPQPVIVVPSSPRSAAHALATLGDRSFEVRVEFRDPHPSESQLATVNSVLATLHPAPPQRVTNQLARSEESRTARNLARCRRLGQCSGMSPDGLVRSTDSYALGECATLVQLLRRCSY